MFKIKKIATLLCVVISTFCSTNIQSKADEEVKSINELKITDIKKGNTFISKQYPSGIMGTRQCIKISEEEPIKLVHKLGALTTDYFNPKMIKDLSETNFSGFTTTEAVSAEVTLSETMTDLIKVGCDIAISQSVRANAGAGNKMSTQIRGSFTKAFSNEYTNDHTITINYDTNTIDKSKKNVALGYVIECIKFKVEESWEEENRIFVGWKKKNEKNNSNYYAYVYTSMWVDWIYDDGAYYGSIGEIHEINK